MEPGYPEHRPFDPSEAVPLRVAWLEARADEGDDSQLTQARKARILAMEAKMTSAEIQAAWEEAYKQFNKSSEEDDQLKQQFSGIGSAAREAYEPTGDEISELAQYVDKHLGRPSGQADEEEPKQ